jgi:hypothetical protein
MSTKLTQNIFSGGFIYTFHRADGFYPLSFPDDMTALAQVPLNPGTLAIINQSTRTKIYEDKTTGMERPQG